ncbi:competence type IV pilus assembly protein ComGB [Vaginisenegalia massiliensis]|uniref:competence type IV pilus assembly protein ComGB n=1 Tax=Vaginisenegalia massiliensis TaxID=2058294 RepID=UPI000F547FBE|nr:competence type IV pilus assembly protein ComGB [Vaginisenegalia massiliensis]
MIKPITILKWFKGQGKRSKLSLNDQIQFLKALTELLNGGFSLSQSLTFLPILLPNLQNHLTTMEEQLNQGQEIEEVLQTIGFGDQLVSQVYFARQQGRLLEGLRQMTQQLLAKQVFVKKLSKTLFYPICLLIFLLGLLVAMRQFILPNLLTFISPQTYQKEPLLRFLIQFFSYLPQIGLAILSLIIVSAAGLDAYLRKRTSLQRWQFWTQFWPTRKWARLFLTQKVARDFGQFLQAGFSLQQIVSIVQANPTDRLQRQLFDLIGNQLMKGIDFPVIIHQTQLFTDVFPLVIYHGQLTSQTGFKCCLYADKLWDDSLEEFERKLNLLQPILFALIAVFILALYLMLMLPMLTMDNFNI